MSLELTTKIGEGRSRECWETANPSLIVKKPKADVVKHYPSLGVTAHFSGRVYRALAYGTTDINRDEAAIAESLPPGIRAYLPEQIQLEEQADTSESLLVMSRPHDQDGKPSRTVQETGKIENERFWQHIDHLVQRMLENELYFCDIFWKGNNILVQRVSDQEERPVLIDVKRLGNSMYPYQLPLKFKAQLREKFLRRLAAFKQEFQSWPELRTAAMVRPQNSFVTAVQRMEA